MYHEITNNNFFFHAFMYNYLPTSELIKFYLPEERKKILSSGTWHVFNLDLGSCVQTEQFSGN